MRSVRRAQRNVRRLSWRAIWYAGIRSLRRMRWRWNLVWSGVHTECRVEFWRHCHSHISFRWYHFGSLSVWRSSICVSACRELPRRDSDKQRGKQTNATQTKRSPASGAASRLANALACAAQLAQKQIKLMAWSILSAAQSIM